MSQSIKLFLLNNGGGGGGGGGVSVNRWQDLKVCQTFSRRVRLHPSGVNGETPSLTCKCKTSLKKQQVTNTLAFLFYCQ